MKGILSLYKQMHLTAKISFWGILILYSVTLMAPILAPYDYAEQHRKHPHAPITKIHFIHQDENGSKIGWPYVCQYKLTDVKRRIYKEDVNKKYAIQFWTEDNRLFGTEKRGKIFLLGTDSVGRDIFSRILYGGRISLTIPLAGVFISLFFGLLIGSVSGYFGGLTDDFVMGMCLIIMSIPGFPLLIVLAGVIPSGVSSAMTFLMIVVIMSFIGWAGLARVIRGMTASTREQDFVTASKALGASHWWIITRHILPSVLNYAIISASMSIPGYIMGESGLSMIGLGIQEPQASWGNMLSEAMKNVQILSSQPTLLVPGLMILFTVMYFNFLGDFLRDFYDPRTKRSLG